MVVAEEQRRKKALEERREAQRMAARRFRSALGRVKSSTKAQGKVIRNCSSQTAIECKFILTTGAHTQHTVPYTCH